MTTTIAPDPRTTVLALARELTAQLQPAAPVDYKIRKDCPVCRHHITKAQVTHPGTVEILPQDGGWWQLMHTRCLRHWVVTSYGVETVIDISGPMPGEGERDGDR